MRILTLITIAFSPTAFSEEIMLENHQRYIVPAEKVWIIQNVEPIECRVCTSDVYVDANESNVEIQGVMLSGNFELSFGENTATQVKLHEGTEIFLGDTRLTLSIKEVHN